MSRKARSRKRPQRRRRRSPAAAPVLARAIGGTVRGGWGRLAFGIVIGLALGLVAVFYSDLRAFDRPGSADKVIAAAAPESRDPSTGARVTIEPPKVVEPANTAATPAPNPQPVAQPQFVEQAAVARQSQPGPSVAPIATKVAAADAPLDVFAGGSPDDASWLRNAVAFSVPRGQPMIAIVLDDVGVNLVQAEHAIKLPPEITLAFMTYANGVDDMAARARALGHEVMVHVPMEPLGDSDDPGPNALKVELREPEILARLRWGLDRFDGYIGVNNHMGSRFTQDERAMRVVMQELRRRNLLFLDSRTIASSVGDRLARELGVAYVSRDVFLDDDLSATAVARQLAAAEHVARESGQAIAIGHPHAATIATIKAWLPGAKARGFVIAPLSVVARRRLGPAG